MEEYYRNLILSIVDRIDDLLLGWSEPAPVVDPTDFEEGI